MSGTDIAEFLTGAAYLITNEYEYELLRTKLDIEEADLDGMGGVVVTTRGADGVLIRAAGAQAHVPAASVAGVVDPTGGGDAFRAGFAAGVVRGLPSQTAAALGCQLAAYAITEPGGQEYALTASTLCRDLALTYGEAVAEAVSRTLNAQP